MTTAIDDDTDELIDTETGAASTETDPEDKGNTPDSPEELAAAAEARAKAVKQLAADADAESKGAFIPKGRFDEVNEERRALARQLADVTAALAAVSGKQTKPEVEKPAAEFDLKTALKHRLDALNKGDDDKVIELEHAIQEHTLKVATERAMEQMRKSSAEQAAKSAAQVLAQEAAAIQAKYPQLDSRGESANAEAIEFVIYKRDRLLEAGKGPAESLREATALAAKIFRFDEEKVSTSSDAAADRLIAARKRNAEAAAQQPPELGGKGDRSTRQVREDVASMSDEEFAALPLAERKRLRGDM